MKTKKLIFAFLLISISGFSQQKSNISGKITSENKILPDAVIELQINKSSKFAVANSKGIYKFSDITFITTDSLQLKVKYLGYKTYKQQLTNLQEKNVFDINLNIAETELQEVVIKTDAKITETAGKSIYKIYQKDYIKNAKVTDILSKLPSVYFNKYDEKATVDGTITGKIFIDGIEAMPKETEKIDVTAVDKVEVINNPSAAYGTDFTGAIINIITKKSTEQYFKGSIGLTGGGKNNYGAINPYFAYKKGILNFNTDMQYLENNQILNSELIREDENGTLFQTSINNTKAVQKYINARIGLTFNERSVLTITGFESAYNFKGDMTGNSTLNNSNNSFTNENELMKKDLEISSVYRYKINDRKTLYFKNLYAVYNELNSSKFNNLQTNYLEANSKNKELTWNIDYDITELKIFNKPATINTGSKYIDRNYSFTNTTFYINQNTINAYFDMNNDWTEKFSTETSFSFENTTIKNDLFSKNFNLILPRFNAVYRFNKKINLKLGYSKRLLRPNPNDLNETLVISSPSTARQGNSNLDFQIRNYFSLKINKSFENDNLSVKLYNESINNSIENVYKKQVVFLIQTLENVGKYNATGFNFSYTTQILKKVDINFDSGLKYNIFENNSPTSLIKKNSGITYNGSISIDTNLFKDKLAVSFSGMHDAPTYSLLSKSISYPYLDLTLSTNLYKEKLNLRLYAQNILGKIASGSEDISRAENFYQNHLITNNFANILLTATYKFGKKFEDIEANKIENDDIR
jgi:Outer membrane protein beta-barrel family/CarboxypepD_reg-like domain